MTAASDRRAASAAADKPTFNFTRRDTSKETVVPFDFQGEEYELYPDRINSLVASDLPSMRISMDSRPMWEFLEGVLGEKYEKFRRIIRDPLLEIDAEEFAGMVKWMIGASGNSPT